MKFITPLLLLAASFLPASLFASHVYGIDFYYTHVSGFTYKINLVIYGDCSGAAFPTFSTATPEVEIYNGGIILTSTNLNIEAPASGVEVTPVCPADSGNTTCVNPSGTIPGIKKFVYSNTVSLPGPSAVWRFVFTGNLVSSIAGRSVSITNISMGPGGGAVIELVDTLNNTVFHNNSAQYTTIPTPFYCLYSASNFNPGAVDADGDILSYQLVPGTDATTASGDVNYIPPYTATAPLGTAPGSFSFSATTGQLAFTPNVVQRGLVVYNVRELRGGVLMGTSQREMTVVVLSSCTNTPADGMLSGATGGTISGGRLLNICRDIGPFSFHLNPSDPDGDTINMTVAGLPSGSTFTITDNNTPAPMATFSWSTTGITPGLYTFFVTYTGVACPLSAVQTIAYSVYISPPLTVTNIVAQDISCYGKNDGTIMITATGGTAPYRYAVDTEPWQDVDILDGLGAGHHYIHIIDSFGCTLDTSALILEPPPLLVTTHVVHPTCEGFKDGIVTLKITGGTAPYQFSSDNISFTGSNSFTTLGDGPHSFYIKDALGCMLVTDVLLVGYPHMTINYSIVSPTCFGNSDGYINANVSGGTVPFAYQLNSAVVPGFSGTFANLADGVYTVSVTDSNNCRKDLVLPVPQPHKLGIEFSITNNQCNSYADKGIIVADIEGGTPPYQIAWSNNPALLSNVNTNLVNGEYSVTVTDRNGCIKSGNATVEYENCCNPYIPNAFSPNADGQNDIIYLKNTGDMEVLGFSIYNRFGERVFFTTNKSIGWNGYYNGSPAELGVYYYFARIICGNKNDQVTIIEGDITLIR